MSKNSSRRRFATCRGLDGVAASLYLRSAMLLRWLPSVLVGIPGALLWVLGFHPGFYYMVDVVLIGTYWLMTPLLLAIAIGIRHLIARRVPDVLDKTMRAREFAIAATIVVVATAGLVMKIPLRLGFLTARPGLERLVEQSRTNPQWQMAEDQWVGLYVISADETNRSWAARHRYPECASEGRVVFTLADDWESAFIYDPRGIENLCYNSGRKGHIVGPWHSMTED